MHKVHGGYTLLARLESDGVEGVTELLLKFKAQPELLPFDDMTTTHFATVTILPKAPYGDEDEELPATLMFATSFCGPVREHVRELIRVMGGRLRELFSHCENFKPDCSNKELERFIREHRRADTFYSGMQDLSPEDVCRQKALREAIEAFVDERQAQGGLTGEPLEVRREIQDHVRTLPDFQWAQHSAARPSGTFLARHWRSLLVASVALPFLASLVVATGVLALFPSPMLGAVVASGWLVVVLTFALLLGMILMIRDHERDQTYVAGRQPDAFVRELAATQNRPVINEFVVSGPIKEGNFRPVFMRLLLWVVARVAEGLPGVKGFRNGINIPTVATARWIAADRGRRLIFISNYTNAAEPYVRDFIDIKGGAKRINAVFGFGRGYPKTEWVLEGGALTDPNGFIYVVTANQQPTHFWYGPYRDISIDNIKVNRRIREDLFTDLDEDQAKKWLLLL